MQTEHTSAANSSTIHVKRRARREISTEDMEIGQAPSIIIPGDSPISREQEEIALLDTPLMSDYAKSLAFNEDILTIRLERSSEEFAPQIIDVYVNGRAEWLPVGVPVKVARKYVEILARAKPDSVQTNVIERAGEDPENTIDRYTSAKHPFSVLHDPSHLGFEWLTRIMMER